MYQEKDEMATISWGRWQLVTQDAVSPGVMVVGGRILPAALVLTTAVLAAQAPTS